MLEFSEMKKLLHTLSMVLQVQPVPLCSFSEPENAAVAVVVGLKMDRGCVCVCDFSSLFLSPVRFSFHLPFELIFLFEVSGVVTALFVAKCWVL